jgi:inner membrane protein involved in colicin E2 resistance
MSAFVSFKFPAQKTSCHPAIHAPIFKGLHEPAPQGMSGSFSFEIRPAFEGRIILESIGLLSSMDTRRQEESPMFSGPFVPSAHIVRDKGRNFISHLPAARNLV